MNIHKGKQDLTIAIFIFSLVSDSGVRNFCLSEAKSTKTLFLFLDLYLTIPTACHLRMQVLDKSKLLLWSGYTR